MSGGTVAVWSQQPTATDSTSIAREGQLKEVVVSAQGAQQRLSSVQIGAEQLQLKELRSAPSLFGEQDIMRQVQLLPGVKQESEASSGFQVRGGTSVQNQILYDEAPVYNAGHIGGLFSAFNAEALAAATLYKGMTPAMLGGASSAVLDLTARTGNRQQWHGLGSIGLLSAKGSLEGPIQRNKGAFLVCARRSYMDLFLKQTKDFRDNTMFFYDVNLKADYQLSDRDQLLLTFFTSRDRLALEDMVDMRWKNITATLRWVHQMGSSARSQTTLLHSTYKTDNGFDLMGLNFSYTGHIRHTGLHQDFMVQLGNHKLNAGLQSLLMRVKTAEWQQLALHEREERRAWDANVWLNDVIKMGSQWQLSAGLRLNVFSALGGAPYYDIDEDGTIIRLFKPKHSKLFKTYITPEPRLSLTYRPTATLSLKAGYSHTSQNIHALRNQSTSTPFDRYMLSSNLAKPERAHQLSAGFFAMTPTGSYDLSVEGYWRTISNVLDYRDGKNFGSAIELERLVLAGDGRSYGMEFCLRKNSGRLTGWIAYTLAWAQTRIDGVNQGRWYWAAVDRRHDIDIVAAYHLTKRWTLNATWIYYSGQAFTAPSAKYEIEDNWVYYYAERNGYRAPATHRLDVSATWTMVTPKTHTTREWAFGIYNLYNRKNPFLISFEDSEDGTQTTARQYSLFGLVPSVSFTVRF
jgi:hypothetical protein